MVARRAATIDQRTTLELNYIGNKGTNLLMRQNIAQSFPYDPANPLPVEARRPFPNFVVYIDSNWGGGRTTTRFNTKLEHRGRGSLLTFAYTWAKSTDSKSAAAGIGASGFNGWQGFLNNHDPERDHGLSDFDVDHRLVGSFVYNLPFGNGEHFAGDATGVKNAIVGGWQVNGIYTWQHGFPITIQAADLGGLNDTFGSNRADIVGDPDVGDQTVEHWYNTAAFAQPGSAVRQHWTQHPARPRRQQPRFLAVQELRARHATCGCSSGSSRSISSITRSSSGANTQRFECDVRGIEFGATGTHQPARVEIHILTGDRRVIDLEGRCEVVCFAPVHVHDGSRPCTPSSGLSHR